MRQIKDYRLKKVLIVASVVSFIEWFQRDSIRLLKDKLNCDVHIACDFGYVKDTDESRTWNFIHELEERGIQLHQISFARSPFDKKNLAAFFQLKSLLAINHFDLIHCHTPMASIVTRTAAVKYRSQGTRVIYTCHGFHFCKGAPLLNWLLFYPVEKLCSYWTDLLITINREDSCLAQKKMKARRVEYIPGIGLDVEKFAYRSVGQIEKRQALGIPSDAFVILSVGELNQNKNHETMIEAVKKLSLPNVHYVIAGKGDYFNRLSAKAKEYGLEDKIHLLGFRNDIADLYPVADVFAFPSFREGLPVSIMEALAGGLPIVCSRIRGNVDLVHEKQGGFWCDPAMPDEFAEKISMLYNDSSLRERMGTYNRKAVSDFSKEKIAARLEDLYSSFLVNG